MLLKIHFCCCVFVVIAVGKSCLLLQFTDKRFQPVHDLTIGKHFDSCLSPCMKFIICAVCKLYKI